MLWADTVMGAAQTGLEIGEHEVNDRQECLGNLHVAGWLSAILCNREFV